MWGHVWLRSPRVRHQSRQMPHPRPIAADQKQRRTLGRFTLNRAGRSGCMLRGRFRRPDQLQEPTVVRLMAKPCPDESIRTRHDVLIC